MELKDILAISGQPGLYKYVAQSARGVIVESLTDGRRSNASATSRVSTLTEISMFTEGEDISLVEIFKRLLTLSEGKAAINHKESSNKIKAAFESLLPEYDRERVHISDMKRCFAWYNALIAAGATSFEVAGDEA